MKSTFFVAALMSSKAMAQTFEQLANSFNNDLDYNEWKNLDPVQAVTKTTTTTPYRPAVVTTSRYVCTTTPAVAAAVTSGDPTHLEWDPVNQYERRKAVVDWEQLTSVRLLTTTTTTTPVIAKAVTTSVSVEAVKTNQWHQWNSATTTVRLLTITSSSTLQVKTITETLAEESSTVRFTTPGVDSQIFNQYVTATNTFQVVNSQPPVNGQPPVNAAVQTPNPANPGLPNVPVQASAKTSNIVYAQPSVVAAYTGTATGIQSQLILMLTVMAMVLFY